MTRDLRLPDNVHLARRDRPQTFHLDGLRRRDPRPGVRHPGGHRRPRARLSRRPTAGCFNIGLLHTCATGREGHDRYAPCTVDDLRAKGYDYWALGHVHTREILATATRPIVFPGNIQGRHIRETGPKGCLLVDRRAGTASPRRSSAGSTSSAGRPAGVDASGRHRRRRRPPGRRGPAAPACSTGADDRPLAAPGRGRRGRPRHDEIARRPRPLDHRDPRPGASSSGAGRLWVEKVKLRTRPLRLGRRPAATGRSTSSTGSWPNSAATTSGSSEFAGRELADLDKKLPPELRRADARRPRRPRLAPRRSSTRSGRSCSTASRRRGTAR